MRLCWLARRITPLETLEELWRNRFTELLPPPARTLLGPLITREIEQSLAAFGNAGMYQLRQEYLLAPLLCTSVYNLEPLRRTLLELINEDKLNQPEDTRLVLGAVNVATGEPNLEPKVRREKAHFRIKAKYFDNRCHRLEIDHIIASASIPPAFPMTPIGGQNYWDGGLFLNTPLGKVCTGRCCGAIG